MKRIDEVERRFHARHVAQVRVVYPAPIEPKDKSVVGRHGRWAHPAPAERPRIARCQLIKISEAALTVRASVKADTEFAGIFLRQPILSFFGRNSAALNHFTDL
jgi:hypothetical protein